MASRTEGACMNRARNRFLACAVLAALLPVAAPTADAALYKWVDANGRTVYSDQVPPGVKAEPVSGAAPAANPNAVKELGNKEAEFRKRQLDRAEDGKKAEKARADAQKLATVCAQARAQIVNLRSGDFAMYTLNDKGERVFLDDAGRKAEIGRLEQSMRERSCPPG
jgi:hypothetical protein